MPGNVRLQSKDGRQYDWIILSDFSSGIVQRPYGGVFTPATATGNNFPYTIASPDKPSAQWNGVPGEGTFGCIANPNGGLQPLPCMVSSSMESPQINSSIDTPFNYEIVLLGVISQMVDPSTVGAGSTFADAMYLLIQYIEASDTQVITELRELAVPVGNSAFSNTANISPTTGSLGRYYYNGPMVYYWNESGSALATIGFAGNNPSTNFLTGLYLQPASGSPDGPIGDTVPGWFFSHQGRILCINKAPGQFQEANINVVSFTDPPESDSLGDQQTIVVPVNFDDITCFGSLSSGELLLLCRQYGGVIVSGDIDDPIITTVPGVQGTQSLAGAGLITPIGMVYLSGGSGAWVWNGGAGAQKISNQLANNFYDTGIGSLLFSICQYDSWLLFPNNWIYDINMNSWWQLPPNTEYQYEFYAVVNYNTFGPAIVAFPGQIVNSNPIYASVIGFENGYSDWQWLSNPMILSQGEMVELREVVLSYTADTEATITVTIWQRDISLDPVVSTFTATVQDPSTSAPYKPIQQRIQCYAQTDVVTIQVTIANAGRGAVNVDSIAFGYRTEFHLATI